MFYGLKSIITLLSICCMTGSLILAQDETGPRPDMAAVSVESWEQPREATVARDIGRPKEVYQRRFPQSYFSPTLRGHFMAQWMYINSGGRQVEFWGSRIVRLEPDSPMRQLGLHAGDVITRLDGLPIWRGMYKEAGQPWQIVELENHFGRTEVRFIHRGQNRVQIGDIMLDGSVPDGFDDLNPIHP